MPTENTLLSTLWNTDGDAEQAAETIISALEKGELELTGNFSGWRETENADFWRKDSDNE